MVLKSTEGAAETGRAVREDGREMKSDGGRVRIVNRRLKRKQLG